MEKTLFHRLNLFRFQSFRFLSRNSQEREVIMWVTLFLFLTGSKLLPDFFLDVEGYDPQEMVESQKKMTQSTSQGSSGEGVAQIFDKIKSLGDEELVRSVNGVFEFHLDGKEPGVWFVDLKNNSGKDRLDATVLSSALFESQRSKNSIEVLIKIKRRQI